MGKTTAERVKEHRKRLKEQNEEKKDLTEIWEKRQLKELRSTGND